jgi:hypothetical protein
VALEEDLVPGEPVVLALEEVVEADLVERGRAGEGGEVAADALRPLVGPHHHHGRVPPDEGPDAPLQVLVTGEPRLLLGRDGVHVRRGDRGREPDLQGTCPLQQLGHEEARSRLAVGVDDRIEAVQPLARLAGIDVGHLVHEAVEDHGAMLAAP